MRATLPSIPPIEGGEEYGAQPTPPALIGGVFTHEFKDMKPIDLIEHPEGGRFREVFRSARTVTTREGDTRSVLTHIYFSLKPGEVSRFHKVTSDEVWNLYRGAGLNLYIWDGIDARPACITLSAGDNRFCHVVPAGTWQAAEPVSDEVLVGCSVAPGFEFADFTLIEPDSEEAKSLLAIPRDGQVHHPLTVELQLAPCKSSYDTV